MAIFKAPRITTADRIALVLGLSEIVYDTDLNGFFGGDGVTAGGNAFTSLGDVYQYSFETVNKNLKAWSYTLNYTGDVLNSIVYTDGVDTITKTLNYTGDKLTSIVLSGDTPTGIDLTKTLTYTGDQLTSVAYT